MSFDYQAYLASREWAVRREAVRKRSGNQCERIVAGVRCQAKHESTHHTTYARIGHELLDDLMAVCNDCHRYLSGKTVVDKLVLRAQEPGYLPSLKVQIASYERGNAFRLGRLKNVAKFLALSMKGRKALSMIEGLYDHKGCLTVFSSTLPDEWTRSILCLAWEGCAGIADWWEPKETVSYAVNGVIYNWDGNRSMPYSSTTSMTAEEIVEA